MFSSEERRENISLAAIFFSNPFSSLLILAGEMIVGPIKALFMDEISTELDSSTTYQIVSCL